VGASPEELAGVVADGVVAVGVVAVGVVSVGVVSVGVVSVGVVSVGVAVVGVVSVGVAVVAGGGVVVAAVTWSSRKPSLVAALNSREACPSDRASFGSLFEPKINSAMTRMMSSSGAPISTMPPVRDHDPVADLPVDGLVVPKESTGRIHPTVWRL
jgi:hypothetical protein